MNHKYSILAAGLATVVIVATLGIIGIIGQQQMASALTTKEASSLRFPIIAFRPDVPNCPPGTFPFWIGPPQFWECRDPVEQVLGPG